MRRLALTLALAAGFTAPLVAQDQERAQDAIRIGITYRPGDRPGLVVVPGPGIDSVRAMVKRDLDYSDRFQMIQVPTIGAAGAVNTSLYRDQFGADHAVELVALAGGAVRARLHDLATGSVRNEEVFSLPSPSSSDFRMAVHRMSDEITRWADGTPGYAASRLVFLLGDRLW